MVGRSKRIQYTIMGNLLKHAKKQTKQKHKKTSMIQCLNVTSEQTGIALLQRIGGCHWRPSYRWNKSNMPFIQYCETDTFLFRHLIVAELYGDGTSPKRSVGLIEKSYMNVGGK